MDMPTIPGRETIEYDETCGVVVIDKPGINFLVCDVGGAHGSTIFDLSRGSWFPYHADKKGAKAAALAEFKRRCDEVRDLL